MERLFDGNLPVLILETSHGPSIGPDISAQYYAEIGGRFDLVRVESFSGSITRNNYCYVGQACGPPPPNQTEAEWIADILSKNRLRLMRALTWVGGSHWDFQTGARPDNDHEDPQTAILIRKIRNRDEVVTKLRELADTSDRWLNEPARLALTPMDFR